MERLSAEDIDERLSFAYKHLHLDWSNVLFSKFGKVRCVSVWAAITEYGPFRILMSDEEMNVNRYLQILNDIVLPFLIKNENMIYVQVNTTFSWSI